MVLTVRSGGGCYEIAGALPKEIRNVGKLSERLPRKGLDDSAGVSTPGTGPAASRTEGGARLEWPKNV